MRCELLEEQLKNEKDISMYRMFTPLGMALRIKIAIFYYHHYNIMTRFLIQIPLLIVDVIDSIVYWTLLKRKEKKYE